MKKIFIYLCLIAIGSIPLYAQTQTWKIDPVHTSIRFSVKHMVITRVVGQFKEYDATLVISKADYSDAVLQVTIDTRSVDTGDKDRDLSLISKDFFNVERFPSMTFESKSMIQIDETNFKLTGELILLGVKRTVVLETSYGGTITDPYGNTRSGWQALTTINRFDYGMNRSRFIDTGGLIAGEDINIIIDAEFILQ